MRLLQSCIALLVAQNTVHGFMLTMKARGLEGVGAEPSAARAEGVSRRALLSSIPAAATLSLLASPVLAKEVDSGRAAFEAVSNESPLGGRKSPISAPKTDQQFTTLANGVKIKDFKEGTGAEIKPTSTVWFQATGRMLNLNGVKFFSTKDNVKDALIGPEPLIIKFGAGQMVPGLEQGMVGMKRGGVRRIIVPAALGYTKEVRLEPQPLNVIDQNALKSVVLNPQRDATILFDVSIERVSNK